MYFVTLNVKNLKTTMMRCICIYIILFFFAIPPLKAQEKEKRFELEFSLIHPISIAQEMDYYYGLDYSLDPTLEVLYNFPVSSKFVISSGIYFQNGKHIWEELLRKPVQYPDGSWYPSRATWSRQLRFFSLGLPILAELKTNNFLINSIFAGMAVGNHVYLNLKERMKNSNEKYSEAEPPDYRWYFWDVYFGIRKTIVRSPSFNLGIKPKVGYKNNRPNRTPGKSNYFYYGIALSTKLNI